MTEKTAPSASEGPSSAFHGRSDTYLIWAGAGLVVLGLLLAEYLVLNDSNYKSAETLRNASAFSAQLQGDLKRERAKVEALGESLDRTENRLVLLQEEVRAKGRNALAAAGHYREVYASMPARFAPQAAAVKDAACMALAETVAAIATVTP